MPAVEARVHATVVSETPYQETCIVSNVSKLIKDKKFA
jgi:hypothetical protein